MWAGLAGRDLLRGDDGGRSQVTAHRGGCRFADGEQRLRGAGHSGRRYGGRRAFALSWRTGLQRPRTEGPRTGDYAGGFVRTKICYFCSTCICDVLWLAVFVRDCAKR